MAYIFAYELMMGSGKKKIFNADFQYKNLFQVKNWRNAIFLHALHGWFKKAIKDRNIINNGILDKCFNAEYLRILPWARVSGLRLKPLQTGATLSAEKCVRFARFSWIFKRIFQDLDCRKKKKYLFTFVITLLPRPYVRTESLFFDYR